MYMNIFEVQYINTPKPSLPSILIEFKIIEAAD